MVNGKTFNSINTFQITSNFMCILANAMVGFLN
jgi:hypothetical protein